MEFEYTIKGNRVCVDKIREPDHEVLIPEMMEGFPVTELGAYILAGTDVEVVHIPPEVTKIGAYAFYGCQDLKRIYFHGKLEDIGAGIFADTRDIAFFDVTMPAGKRTCLKDILQELHQTIRVRLHEDGVESRLIFPEFYEEALENTPGRQINSQMHGCGLTYRYSFERRVFQPKQYDDLFYHVTVQESEELVCELAIGRLKYPKGLTERSRRKYEAYLQEHWQTAAKVLIEADRMVMKKVTNLDAGELPWLVECVLTSTGEGMLPDAQLQPKQLQTMIDMAQQIGNTEIVSWLMDYRHRMQGMTENKKEIPEQIPARRKRKFVLDERYQ